MNEEPATVETLSIGSVQIASNCLLPAAKSVITHWM